MSLATNVSAVQHTTASSPRPHIVYILNVESNGETLNLEKRYSDFLALDKALGINGRFALPPKRLLATTFIPAAWIDDTLIEERKAGLQTYLKDILSAKEYRSNPALSDFLKPDFGSSNRFELEDALPSTMSRKAAMEMAQELADVDASGVNPATTLAAGYYPDWVESSRPPESIWFGKFDIIYFAFATPNSSSTLNWSNGSSSQNLLRRLVTAANKSGKGTRIVLSVGGWGGSYWFSDAVSTQNKRNTFVNALAEAVNTYGLAGVDLDWEYPNSPGAGNLYSSNDAANFLTFLTALRTRLGWSKTISAAVAHLPWLGANGSPLTNVSQYAAQMSYVNIMNYDVWGASVNPGPNAPLGNLCGTSTQPNASAQGAFSAWTKAGFPANKLMLGLALYGYVSNSNKIRLTGSFAPSALSSTSEDRSAHAHPTESKEKSKDNDYYLVSPAEDDSNPSKVSFLSGAHPRNTATPSGFSQAAKEVSTQAADLRRFWGQQIAFSQLVGNGALVRNADGNYGQAGGFTYAWDDCSDTPFLYRPDQSTVVSFDDTWSLTSKARYAKSVGMAGVFTWSLDQDDSYNLMEAIRSGIGRGKQA